MIFLIYVCQEKLSIMHHWIKVIWQSCLLRHFRQILQWTCEDIAQWITFFGVFSISSKWTRYGFFYLVIWHVFICSIRSTSCFLLYHGWIILRTCIHGSSNSIRIKIVTVSYKLHWEISKYIPLKFNIFHPFTKMCKSDIRNLLMVKMYH